MTLKLTFVALLVAMFGLALWLSEQFTEYANPFAGVGQ